MSVSRFYEYVGVANPLDECPICGDAVEWLQYRVDFDALRALLGVREYLVRPVPGAVLSGYWFCRSCPNGGPILYRPARLSNNRRSGCKAGSDKAKDQPLTTAGPSSPSTHATGESDFCK